ncbi:MAG: alpha-2-macroglobulin [Saprospiraceae bacterium]|nr:alpha-2-macroglobulin [Saprospiraceae bacterium]
MLKSIKLRLFFALSFLTLLTLFISSCKKDQAAEPMNEAVSSYVSAYSSGTLSRNASLRVRFTQAAVEQEMVGAEIEEKLLILSPAVAGKTYWEDPFTLVFQPTEYLDPATTYVATVYLNKIFDGVPDAAKSFEFDFHTRELQFTVEIEGLHAPNPADLSKQEIHGLVRTTDISDDTAIEGVVSATQNGQDKEIQWTHEGDGMVHRFQVKNVSRGDKAGAVLVSWNGKALGVSKKEDISVEVPSLSDFKVTNAKVYQSPQQYIVLYFSDPINPEQDLKGLIRIQDQEGDLSFNINGNQILIYPSGRIKGDKTILVEAGLRNTQNLKMAKASQYNVTFTEEMPAVFLVGRGVIMPNSDGLFFPFEAVNLDAVEVEVFKIFNNNIIQFLQYNDLDGEYELERVGRIVFQKKVELSSLNPAANSGKRVRYALDLSKLVEADPEAIYQVRIGFRPEYTGYYCGEEKEAKPQMVNYEAEETTQEDYNSIFSGWYGINGYYNGYNWQHREDPCFPAYYNSDRFISRNVLVSNLGLIVKTGRDKTANCVITDLRTGKPVSGAKVSFYDFQQQLIGTLTTNGEGFGKATLERDAFVAIAHQGKEVGYLKMDDGMALQLSRFDVEGVQPQNGLKGFLYGERGVWRPGDSIYLHFVLEDQSGALPGSHPIQFELFDARGQLFEKRVTSANVGQIYPLHIATSSDSPTGNWLATVKVGGASFSKTLSVETVKPNRLKIALDFGGDEIRGAAGEVSGTLRSTWLHGAPASNLKARVESQLRAVNTSFDNYKTFEFDDPARQFNAQPQVIFDGTLDAQGAAPITANLLQQRSAPGKLRASFKTRVFEKGGDASIDQVSLPFSPYTSYAGVEIPMGKYGEKRLDIGREKTIKFVLVDEAGKPLANKSINIGLYRVQWRWWWDSSNDRLADYATGTHYNAQQKTELVTDSNGQAEWAVQVNDWGRYMIRVCDTEGQHCSGDFFYAGYPWYDDDGGNQQEAAMLAFTSSQEQYEVGQTVELRVPASADGRILLSLENGTEVLETRWEEAQSGENIIRFKATADMAPTIYANISLIQPHAKGENDLPMRMYGVLPIKVEDPATRISPTIKMPEVLEPEQTVTIEVSEEAGKAMAYTLAIVDDGLLDLTRFETPNPWNSFYAKEALGVQTFDVYDFVLGGFGGEFERILSIGGDAENDQKKEEDSANRFKPVVLHLGPFFLEKGKKAKHEITMPNYVGSVRVMVVAANKAAYGKAEKTVPVRKPLMVLATLPRVLGPGETLQLPVDVFAMEEGINNVSVKITESSGLVSILQANSQSLNFKKTGDQLAFFDLQVGERIGIARFNIEVSGHGKKASQDIEIEIRNPNPYVTEATQSVLEGSTEWVQNYQALGMPGTNEATLEVSSLPPINLDRHLEYLLHYPYGCLEQTLSSGFPQLYLAELVDLTEDQKKKLPENIRATIDRLRNFQQSNGGFSYWPGNNHINQWSNTYAGHFLLEAREKGYSLPNGMLDRWVDYQRKLARLWDPRQFEAGFYSYQSDQLSQAYRLYTLALANQPELGAMNRLREMNDLGLSAKWRLALAYAVAGKPDIASQMVAGLGSQIKAYRETGNTFGSALRDRAMILETMNFLDMRKEAAELVKILSEDLSSSRWLSTQDLSYNLLAIGKFVGKFDLQQTVAFEYQLGQNAAVNAAADKPLMLIQLPPDGGQLKVKNTGNGILYARIIRRGQPLVGDQTDASSNLKLLVQYKDLQGNQIDPGRIEQGTDFVAEVTVTHPGFPFEFRYEEMALDQIFPSGWEVTNSRMTDVSYFSNSARPEYQDFRDDRVISFFDIYPAKQQIYRVQLTASYPGRYYLPSLSCEAMYDDRIYARHAGRWVEVIRNGAG